MYSFWRLPPSAIFEASRRSSRNRVFSARLFVVLNLRPPRRGVRQTVCRVEVDGLPSRSAMLYHNNRVPVHIHNDIVRRKEQKMRSAYVCLPTAVDRYIRAVVRHKNRNRGTGYRIRMKKQCTYGLSDWLKIRQKKPLIDKVDKFRCTWPVSNKKTGSVRFEAGQWQGCS